MEKKKYISPDIELFTYRAVLMIPKSGEEPKLPSLPV